MAALDIVHVESLLEVRPSKDSDTILLTFELEADGNPTGNSRMVAIFTVGDTIISFEVREVDGISYRQNPSTGAWETKLAEMNERDPFVSVFLGQLIMENVDAKTELKDGRLSYHLSGTLPEGATGRPLQGDVSLWVHIDDLRVYRMEVKGIVPSGEWEGLLLSGQDDLFETIIYDISRYNEPVNITPPDIPFTPQPTASPTPLANSAPRGYSNGRECGTASHAI